MSELDDGTPSTLGPDTGTAGTGVTGGAPPAQPTADDADLDLLYAEAEVDADADSGEDNTAEVQDSAAAERVGDEQAERSPWPERPDSLKDATAEEIKAWREEQGLPAREAYQLPELDEGKQFTDYGRVLSAKVVDLAYELDMSPAQAQQLILRGDGVLKAIAEARDTEDQRTGSKALLDEFGGDREAVKAHVTQARVALKKALPEGLRKVVLESRGPDGRKLAYNPDFLRWAAQMGANQPARGQQNVTEQLKAELAEITELQNRDVDELYRPWKATGMNASDRKLAILRQIDSATAEQEHQTAVRSAGSDEERALLELHRSDPKSFEFGRWKGSGISPAKRLYDLRNGQR